MELLHSNKAVSSVFHSHNHDFPDSSFRMDSTMAILKAISKAHLKEEVRVHLLEKFFEELGCLSTETTQGARKEETSHSMNKDTKDDMKSSLEDTKDDRKGSKHQKETDEEQSNKRVHTSTPSSVFNLEKDYHKEDTDGCKQGETSYENLTSFLKEASDCGAIVLNDIDLVLQAFLKAFSGHNQASSCTDIFGQANGERKTAGESIMKEKISQNNCQKERENSFCPKGLCPMDNSPCAVYNVTAHTPPKSAHTLSATFQNKDNSFLTKDKACRPQNVKDFSCSCSDTIQNKKDGSSTLSTKEREVHSPHAPHSDFRGVQTVDCSKQNVIHVKNNTEKLSFLEAAKKAISSTLSPIAEKEKEGKGFQSSVHVDYNSPILKIDNQIFQKRMEMCKYSVIGKVTLQKGEEPWIWSKLKEKLDFLWGFNSGWRLISLGKGFFHIILNCQEELNKIWSKSVLQLKPGVLRLQRWTFGFDPSKERTTRTQVWFRICQLPWCLWDPSIINGIAQRIGVPLRIDKTTLEGNYGHFARVLVDVDVSKPIMSSILLECDNKLLEIKIVPENLPSFCKGCSAIGHLAIDCKTLNKTDSHKASPQPVTAETSSAQRRDNSNSLKREAQTSEWRKKKMQATEENLSSKVIPSTQLDMVNAGRNIVETITDFSAQVEDHSTKNARSDCILFSNQFSVLQSEDEIEDVVQSKDKVAPKESSPQLSLAEEEFIPKVPHRWSDILDEEDEKERTYSLQEVNDSIMRATSNFHHSFSNMSEFRAQLNDVWITRDDSRFDRDMYAEIDHASYSPKHARSLITHIPRKDKKVKIGFRQPPPK